LVGAMLGIKRSILPAIAEQEVHVAARTAVLSFIVVFTVTKALTNYLAGPQKRGLAMGLNEFTGHFAVAASARATGWIAARYGLRPEPFYLGIGDVAHPSWRASSVGVYRLWRDLDYAIGALLAGLTKGALGLPAAMRGLPRSPSDQGWWWRSACPRRCAAPKPGSRGPRKAHDRWHRLSSS